MGVLEGTADLDHHERVATHVLLGAIGILDVKQLGSDDENVR